MANVSSMPGGTSFDAVDRATIISGSASPGFAPILTANAGASLPAVRATSSIARDNSTPGSKSAAT
jgi:hypothetical protein